MKDMENCWNIVMQEMDDDRLPFGYTFRPGLAFPDGR